MGRHATEFAALPDGRAVGYSWKVRGGYWRVVFADPADPLRYLERSTGAKSKAAAAPVAGKLILAAYARTLPPDKRRITWDEVAAEIDQTATIRPATRADYKKAIDALRAEVETDGPHDVTPEVASQFKRRYAAGTCRRREAGRTRSPNTVRAVLRKLSSLWAKHLRELGYSKENPWESIAPPPPLKRKPAVPTDEAVREFMAYLAATYPGWELLRLWVELKAYTASRTMDLCILKSDQLRGVRLVFKAEEVKGRAERSIPLPPDLAAALERVKGPTWLWERFAEDVTRYRPDRNHPGPRPFDPRRLYWCVGNVFAEYNAGRPGKPRLRPHDLRRRAITLMTVATQSVDATAQAIGVDPATARRHYLDAQRAFDSDALFTKLAGVLRPPAEPEGKG